jgi:hypothetical protein
MLIRRLIPALATALAVASISTGAAGAAPQWLPATAISAGGSSTYEAHLASDARGDAVAVWQHREGSNYVIQAATRPAGSGAWSAPVSLSDPGSSASAPRVAIDASGNAVVVWQSIFAVDTVESAALAAGGAWSAPTTISDPSLNASDPQIATTPGGVATVVWSQVNAVGTRRIQTVTRSTAGAWSEPLDLSSDGGSADSAKVAVGDGGDTAVVWTRNNGANDIVQAIVRRPGQGWGSPVSLSNVGRSAFEPAVAVDPAGDAVAVWTRYDGTEEVVQGARVAGSGGGWSAPVDLSLPGEASYTPQVGIDAAGNATAIWDGLLTNDHRISAVTAPAGGGWSAPVVVGKSDGGDLYPTLAVDPAGDAVVVWPFRKPSLEHLQAARRPAGSASWDEPTYLHGASETEGEPDVALDDHGDAVTVWRSFDGNEHELIRSATYDAASPELSGLAIPASGTVGEALNFAVSPLAPVAPLGQTSWSFGDGGTASGASVTHTFGAPGTYPVTVASVDAAGNSTTASGSVSIAAAPASQGGGTATKKAAPAARCPKGSVLRKSKQRVRVKRGAKGKPKLKTKTVLRCVKPTAKKKPAKHRGSTTHVDQVAAQLRDLDQEAKIGGKR